MLSDQELLRYSRQLLLSQIDVAGQQRLAEASVLIVGLGGLGSPVALYLAAAGVGQLHLADFDQVDVSNLQRQVLHSNETLGLLKVASAQQRLSQLNPHVNIHLYEQRLEAEALDAVLNQVDLVLDCCDNFATREQLNRACVQRSKPLVSGAAIRLQGQLTVFDSRLAHSPCYHCLYGDGDEEQLTCSEAGVAGPVVGTIGTLQALEALKLLAGFGEALVGRLLVFDGLTTRFRELKIPRDPSCAVCGVEREQ